MALAAPGGTELLMRLTKGICKLLVLGIKPELWCYEGTALSSQVGAMTTK